MVLKAGMMAVRVANRRPDGRQKLSVSAERRPVGGGRQVLENCLLNVEKILK